MTDENTTTTTEEESPLDIRSITPTEQCRGEVETGVLSGSIDSEYDGAEFGIQVIRDGPLLALTSGTTFHGDQEFKTSHTLTPEDAREIASALVEAADAVEEASSSSESETSQGFLKRVMSNV